MKSHMLSATQVFRGTLFIVLLSAFPFTTLAQLSERVTEICEVVHPIGWVKFKEGINIAGDRVFVDHAENFGLGASDEMRLIRQWTDDLGFTHYRYQQYHAGVPIEYAMFTIQARNGRSVSGNGRIAAHFRPHGDLAVTKQQALQTAVSSLPYGTPSWLDNRTEEFSRRVLNVSEFTSYPEFQLMFVRRNGEEDYSRDNLALAYKIHISTTGPAAHFEVCIDATNREVIRKIRNTTGCTGDTATGATLYNGVQNITVTEFGSDYLLEAACHGTTIRTVKVEANDNSLNTTKHQNVVLTNPEWPDTDEYNRYAQAQWGAQVTHEYFRTRHQHNSYNNANALMLQVVGGNQATNWYQNQGILAVRDLSREDLEKVTNWAVALDVIGHEWTHALTCHATELGVATPSGEFGALYESFGDVFGSLIECYGKETYDDDNANDCEDYVLFEDFVTESSGFRRNMITPNEHGHPDTYCGTYWAENVHSFHARGGVQNKWFTLLAKQLIENNQNVDWTGTNNHCCKTESYSVSPIGRTKAATLAFRNLATKVKPHFNYVDAMLGSLACADELITAGKMTSADKEQVVEAWKAVGVYENKVGYTFRRCRTYESNSDETALEAINEIRAGSCGTVGTVVMPGSTLTFTAGNQVLLRGEFVAESGCTFTARIAEPCTTFFAKSAPSRETHPTRSAPNIEAYNRAISAPTLFTAPNPLSGSGSVWFSVSRPSVVRLSVFDNVGRMVYSIVEGETFVAGSYQRSVSTSGLSTGTYICRLVTDEHTVSTIFMVSR
jgi:bacillolysin